VHSLGNATVKANMRRTYDLQLTTLQAVALLTFNGQQDWLSLSDILQRLNVEEEVGKRILHSLACAKHKVLKKEPDQGRAVNPGDKFKVNDAFVSPLRVFRIPMPSLDETHNAKRVEEDRSFAMEAAIVRIMKARKRMQHTNLVAEVLAQLHFFKPNPRVVKRRIEHLIDREYLEREDNNWYSYLA
jgi:cullin 1